MKKFFTTTFGLLGYIIYYPLALVVRVPVCVFLAIFITVWMLIIAPIIGKDDCPSWVGDVYDWYRGK